VIQLYNNDCFDVFSTIKDNHIDLILTDPPYGTTACKWDSIIPFDPMWKELKRIIKDNGCIVLFAQDKFTVNLIFSNINEHKYNLIWNKYLTSGYLNANRMPLRVHEDIVVFYSKQPTYNPQKIIGNKNHSNGNKDKPITNNSYGKHIYKDNSENLGNLKHPKSILNFNAIHTSKRKHTSEKPVALLEYLIKTYTNKNDTVLDFTMGSGSTGVASKNLNRNFIGIEKDTKYFEIAKERIDAII
jgi:site-specific DNA-methyltransferase (adenine-specific)|tara:strand:- start:56 stop:784 length:729 start_codon:yes stop_codon:yes gene_type:complete